MSLVLFRSFSLFKVHEKESHGIEYDFSKYNKRKVRASVVYNCHFFHAAHKTFEVESTRIYFLFTLPNTGTSYAETLVSIKQCLYDLKSCENLN